MSNFSERLKECITEKEISQSKLAESTGISHCNISSFVSGKHLPYFEHFVALLDFFNCSADYLLGLSELHTEEPLHPVPPFGKRLREVLREYKTSQEKLIRALPVSSSVLYHWLAGNRQPTIPMLIKLADYFDCSVDYLIGRRK